MNVHRQWAVTHASSSTLTSIQNRGKLTRSAAVSCAARILATCFLNSQICLCCFVIAFHPPDYGSRVLLHGIQKNDPRGRQSKGCCASNELAGEAGHFDSQPLALGTYSGPLASLHDHQKNNSRVRRFTSRGPTYAFWLCASSASAWPPKERPSDEACQVDPQACTAGAYVHKKTSQKHVHKKTPQNPRLLLRHGPHGPSAITPQGSRAEV